MSGVWGILKRLGITRSAQFPRTMRRPKTVPLVPVDKGCERCCNGILTAPAAEMAWWQRITRTGRPFEICAVGHEALLRYRMLTRLACSR